MQQSTDQSSTTQSTSSTADSTAAATSASSSPTLSLGSDAATAGWDCQSAGTFIELMPPVPPKRFSWFNPRTLWESRNDRLDALYDPVPQVRAGWVEGRTDAELTVDLSQRLTDFTFLLMGDTGEGDESQYAVVPPLLAHQDGAAFLMICSDVLYPVGDVNDYADKFYRPYEKLRLPIYALPGNHDWYDNLHAFMYHLCCDRPAPQHPSQPSQQDGGGLVGRLVRALWRPPAKADATALCAMQARRSAPEQQQPVPQPGPYYVIDTAHLRLVCIDTGIRGDLDQEQGEWLVRVSADPRPKLLLTGKPLYVDGECHPGPIQHGPPNARTVLQVVNRPEFNYRAVIGGDIHNYQHYPVWTGNRTIHHIVSGGGGAFMHATHSIPVIDPQVVPGVTESDFRCYPLRRDSLAAYSRVIDGMLRKLHINLGLTLSREEAAAYLAERLQVTPRGGHENLPDPKSLSARTRAIARSLLLIRGSTQFHNWFSPFYDWDTPPFFKQFLKLDVAADEVTVTCYGVSGCGEHESNPPIEDRVSIPIT